MFLIFHTHPNEKQAINVDDIIGLSLFVTGKGQEWIAIRCKRAENVQRDFMLTIHPVKFFWVVKSINYCKLILKKENPEMEEFLTDFEQHQIDCKRKDNND